MGDDLVKRLREEVNDHMFGIIQSPLQLEAADRIEQLKFILACALADYKSSRCLDDMFFDWIDDASAALEEKKDD
jgi:hypothetical protein